MNEKLEKLKKELKVFEGRTALQLAAKLNCAVPTVYRRIAKLRAAGVRVYELVELSRRPGPVPVKFTRVAR